MRALLLVSLLLLAPTIAQAGEGPGYLVLTTQGHGRAITPVAAQPYAYGWFGAKPGTTWQRSFGYYRNYTQWKAR